MGRISSRTLAAAGIVFVLTLLARFPAPWLAPFLPAAIACGGGLMGTVWSGQCGALAVGGVPIGDTVWTLRAVPLLRARLAGTLALTRVGANVATRFVLGPGSGVVLEDLHADLALDRPLAGLPLPRFTAGTLQADLSRLILAGGRIRELRGRIEARGLEQPGRPPTPLGSYQLRFDSPPQPNGDLVGVVHDLGGPVAFDGTLKLSPARHYLLEGRIATRAGADAGLERVLRFLGRPDADGRRPISQEGTF
jgi:general secretion pathway protein N